MQDLVRIEMYLVNEKSCTEVVAERLAEKLTKYDDIKNGFLHWMKTGTYASEETLEVAGYTPAKIHEIAPVLDGAGVYNFMVTLRDDPEEAQRIIDGGFVAK